MTMQVTGSRQLDAWDQKRIPPIEQVRGGIWAVPVPIPVGTLRYTIVYVVESSDGLALIDVGYNDETAWLALLAGLEHIGCSTDDVNWVFVTHIHRDHYGLAARLQRASGARIGMHPLEAVGLPSRHGTVHRQSQRLLSWMIRSGVPTHEAESMIPSSLAGDHVMEMPEPDLLIEDGDRLPLASRSFRGVWTPGHTPGHLCFLEEEQNLLFAGDHVLPRITSNISTLPGQPANPLAAYLSSLETCYRFNPSEVLPAHQYRFSGLHDRLDDLLLHHEARLAEIAGLAPATHGLTAWQLCQLATWARPWRESTPLIRRNALAETHAHLALLQWRGAVTLDGRNGRDVWTRAPGIDVNE
jgi:glyoxylase-like metal-dependent hydrolase (beta-lactamase superfamily II)